MRLITTTPFGLPGVPVHKDPDPYRGRSEKRGLHGRANLRPGSGLRNAVFLQDLRWPSAVPLRGSHGGKIKG